MPVLAHPLRSKGKKLSPEEVKSKGRVGYLEFDRMPDGQPVNIARLISERGGVLGEMESAQVTRITREGILVTGFERNHLHYRQAWWCVFVKE